MTRVAILLVLCFCSASAVEAAGKDEMLHLVFEAYDAAAGEGEIAVTHPLRGALVPADMAPILFRWDDSTPGVDRWAIGINVGGGHERLGDITQERRWYPSEDNWNQIRMWAGARPVQVTIVGFASSDTSVALSSAEVQFSISSDAVDAPIFYREVNLPFVTAVKDPSKIRWRFGSVSSRTQPPIVLQGLPVCGNCHSFSQDGTLLGMDVDYANDKGSYALAKVEEEIVLSKERIITWSDYRREDGRDTFGLMSQVSPDGRYAVSTVKDRSVFVPKDDLYYSQLFFPIRGILAVHDRATGRFFSLPGADDPTFVQSNPTWSPDGKHIVFARATAYNLKKDGGSVLLTKEECREFLEEGKPFKFDLYQVPFNDGKGGVATPLKGASGNGKSNFFPKYSPDGKWIVYCQAENYMLLQPDSELFIVPSKGGEARRLSANTGRMNSWHSFSPNGRWLVFATKVFSPYTQLMLTHIDDLGQSSPPVLLSRFSDEDRAANIPEFVNSTPQAIRAIHERFLDDVSYVRAGDAFERAGDVTGAASEYRKALDLNPDNVIALSNLGGLLATSGKMDEGKAMLLKAIKLAPDTAAAHYNLGMLLIAQGLSNEALEHLSLAVKHNPQLAPAHADLGALLCMIGRPKEGFAHATTALRLDPTNATAHYCLGRLMVVQGRVDEGIGHLQQAVEYDPGYVEARRALGRILLRKGKHRDAARHLSRALQDYPDDVATIKELALLLVSSADSMVRDPNKAHELASRACELTRNQDLASLDLMAICHAELGRFDEAISVATQAKTLAEKAGLTMIANQIEERISFYKQGKPYRQGVPAARP